MKERKEGKKMKKRRFAAVFLAAAFVLSGCGSKAEETKAAMEGDRSGVEYFADQMSEAMNAAAESRAKEKEEARNEGDGESCVIRTVEDLVKFREQVNGGEPAVDAVLEADLDLSSVCGPDIGSWEPIVKYNGVFEGNGHTISNLYFSGYGEDRAGLFASTDVDSVIQNLSMTQVEITGADYAGAVVGFAQGSIINCQSYGSVCGSGRAAGGIAGELQGGGAEGGPVISDCTNYADVSNTGSTKCIAGGVVGYLIGADAINCRNEGAVSGTAATMGGVFGALEGSVNPAVITDCVNVGSVDGEIYVGGFCGDAEVCVLNRCKNSGSVTGYIYVGGLCGYFGGEKLKTRPVAALMENCSNEGTVSLKYMEYNEYLKPGKAIYDAQQVGGLAGVMETSIVLNSRNGGDLLCTTGKDYLKCGAGYLAVGKYQGNRNTLLNCISTGSITPPEKNEHFENSRTATGKFDGDQDSAQIFYLGEKAAEAIAPTESGAMTDGTVLAALNGFPDGVSEELMTRLSDSGFAYEVSGWKAGADGMPVLEWE